MVEGACGTFHERDLTNLLWVPKQNGTLVSVGTKVNPTSRSYHPGDVCGCLAGIRSILFSTSPLVHGPSRSYRETWLFPGAELLAHTVSSSVHSQTDCIFCMAVPPLETWV